MKENIASGITGGLFGLILAASPAVNDRVLLIQASGTYVILGKIV